MSERKTGKISVEVSIKADAIKSLVDVLSDNIDSLPQQVVDALQRFCEDEPLLYDVAYLGSIGVPSYDTVAYIDGKKTQKVISGDRISRKVHVCGGEAVNAESFWIYHKDKPICGWGEKPVFYGLPPGVSAVPCSMEESK